MKSIGRITFYSIKEKIYLKWNFIFENNITILKL